MSEFHDPELRQQLGRLSGPYPDANEAHAAWQRRVGQVRRRRAVAWTSGAALSLVMATVGVAALQSPGRHSVVPGKSSETSVSVTPSIATTEADESTVEATVPETTAPTTEVQVIPGTEPVLETAPPETEATVAEGPGPSKNHGSPTSAPQAPAGTQTFASIGGSITVRIDGDKLKLVAVHPAAGFEEHESDDSDRKIGVTFTSSNHRSQITVRLSDGVMKPTVTEESGSHEESVPQDSTDIEENGNGGQNG